MTDGTNQPYGQNPPPPPGGTPPPPPSGAPTPPPPPMTGQPSDGFAGNNMTGMSNPAYAGWGSRVGGYFLRGLVIVPGYIGGLIVTVILAQIADFLAVIGLLATFVMYIGVFSRSMIQRGHLGYDFGDAVVGQTLLNAQGQPLGSGWTVFGRALAHIVDAIPLYIGFLWPLWDEKRQTFADKMLNTTVHSNLQQRYSGGELFKNAYMIWKPVLKS